MATAPGTSFKELIKFATQKEGATRADFESAMASKGYHPREVRKLGNAFDRVNSSGNEYILHPTKGFDVFGADKTQKTGSGKVKGNKAGLDLGDFIGLGNDVSLLAGALRKEVPGFEKSKQPIQKAEPEARATVGWSPATADEQDEGMSRLKQTPTKKTSGTASGVQRKIQAETGTGGPYANQETSPKKGLKTFSWEDITGTPEFKALYNKEKAPGEKAPEKSFLSHLLLGDIADTWEDPNVLTDLGAAFNPAQIWSKDAREYGAERGRLASQRQRAEYKQENPGSSFEGRTEGGLPDIGLLGTAFPGSGGKMAKFTLQNLLRSGSSGRTAETIMAEMKSTAAAKGLSTEARAKLINKLQQELTGITTPGPSFTQKTNTKLKDFLGRTANEVKFPMVENIQPKLGPATPNFIEQGVESNFLDNLTEDLNHVQRHGGKMSLGGYLKGEDGIKAYTPQVDNRDWTGEDFMKQDGYNKFADGFQVPTRRVEAPANFRDVSIPAIPSRANYKEMQPVSKGTQGEKTFKHGLRDFLGRNAGAVGAGALQYGVPAAYLLAEQNQINKLRGKMDPHLIAPELMTGSIRDLVKPNFYLPHQPGLEGSSLFEAQQSGLNREKFTREQKANWEMNNGMNRQRQQDAVIDRTNQAAQLKAGITNQNKVINAQNAANEFGYLLQDRGVTASSLFGNLDQGIYGARVAKDSKDISRAMTILHNPDSYSQQEVVDAQRIIGRRKKGGKMKFSKVAC